MQIIDLWQEYHSSSHRILPGDSVFSLHIRDEVHFGISHASPLRSYSFPLGNYINIL